MKSYLIFVCFVATIGPDSMGIDWRNLSKQSQESRSIPFRILFMGS